MIDEIKIPNWNNDVVPIKEKVKYPQCKDGNVLVIFMLDPFHTQAFSVFWTALSTTENQTVR